MSNLIAYIPTLNRRHLKWLKSHPDSELTLISEATAQVLLPRLARNIEALPSGMVARIVVSEKLVRRAMIFLPESERSYPSIASHFSQYWVMPDEDVSRLFAEKYLLPHGCQVDYEVIWARYDMTAVVSVQPVIADVVISHHEFDAEMIRRAGEIALRSSDWWRQIGALAVSEEGRFLAWACNSHMPTEYEPDLFGDSGLNRDAGQEGKYTTIHAECAVIAMCARQGKALEGASLYVTTFPCEKCAREIAVAGIKKVYFRDGYSSLNAQEVLKVAKVEIIQVVSNSDAD